jgi:microcystin-dependent protein
MRSQFVGEIRMFACGKAPDFGWLQCNGQAERYDEYPALGALLGNTYGSSEHTFNLPDLRGRTVVGVDATHPLAKAQGAETVSLADNFPPHTHAVYAKADESSTSKPDGKLLAKLKDAVLKNFPYATTVSAWHTLEAVEPAGSSAAHENMQPSLVIYYYICTHPMGTADGEGGASS